MKRLFLQVVGVAALVTLLAACTNPATGGMTVRLDPNNSLGYEVTGSGPTVESRSFVFVNDPGEPQAMITGVSTAFFASNGVETESWIGDEHSLAIVVPAGFMCDEPHEITGCDVLSPGARPQPGQPSSAEAGLGQYLPHTVALEHWNSDLGDATWWGEFTFVGHNAYVEFEFTKTFYIAAPN